MVILNDATVNTSTEIFVRNKWKGNEIFGNTES